MKKKALLALVVLFSILSGLTVRAQYLEPKYAIYVTSPLGFMSKGGIKIEHRLNLQNALLAGYTQYWGFFPGYQGNFEYRKYFPNRKTTSENFIYAKAGVGFADYNYLQDYSAIDVFNDSHNTTYKAPGTYVLAGGGIGRHINFNWFFIELNAGLKFTQPVGHTHLYNEHLFYTTGPGSIADFNLHFGVQF